MKNTRLAALLSTGFAAMATATAALAQNAPAAKPSPSSVAEDSTGLQDIIVTARRQSENVQKVPVFVTNFTGADLAAKQITNVQDLAQASPNLYSVPNAGTKNSISVVLRGQGQRDNLLTLDPSVGVYVDDVYYARTYEVPASLLDLASVEVLNGPQGTLYGRNTTGGALKFTTVTADPSGSTSGYVKASYGNYNAVVIGGALNVPVIKDILAVRYAGEYRNHDGYTTSYLVPTLRGVPNATGVATSLVPTRAIRTDNENSYAHRLSIRFTPTPDVKLDITASLFHAVDNGTAIFGVDGDIQNYNFTSSPSIYTTSPQRRASFYAGLTDIAPFSVTDVKSVSGSLEWHVSDELTAKLISGYVQGRSKSVTNYDGTVNAGLSFLQVGPTQDQQQHQHSEEFQLKGAVLNNKLDYVVGLYNFQEAGREDAGDAVNATFNNETTDNPQFYANNRSRSVFGNFTVHPTDDWRINGGIRYTSDRKALDASPRFIGDPLAGTPGDTGIRVGPPGTCILVAGTPGVVATSATNGGPCLLRASATFNYVTWEIGTDYQVAPDILVYAKVNRGVRSGGQNARIVSFQPPSSFNPEIVVNYEAGFKSQFLDRHVRLNVSAFHDVLSQAQISQFVVFSDPAGGPPHTNAVIQNGAGAKINGFEVQLVAKPFAHLTLSANAGYNDFKFSNPPAVQPNAPPFTYTLSAAYDTPTRLGDLSARLDYNHISSYYWDTLSTTPGGKLPGYGVLNGRLGLTLANGVEIAAYGRNLLAEEYYRGGSLTLYIPSGPAPYRGTRGAAVGPPRTFGVEATLKF